MNEKNLLSYHAYLLRVWREDEYAPWRGSLEDPHTGQTVHFATIQRLYDFLNGKMAPPAGDCPTHLGESQDS